MILVALEEAFLMALGVWWGKGNEDPTSSNREHKTSQTGKRAIREKAGDLGTRQAAVAEQLRRRLAVGGCRTQRQVSLRRSLQVLADIGPVLSRKGASECYRYPILVY